MKAYCTSWNSRSDGILGCTSSALLDPLRRLGAGVGWMLLLTVMAAAKEIPSAQLPDELVRAVSKLADPPVNPNADASPQDVSTLNKIRERCHADVRAFGSATLYILEFGDGRNQRVYIFRKSKNSLRLLPFVTDGEASDYLEARDVTVVVNKTSCDIVSTQRVGS